MKIFIVDKKTQTGFFMSTLPAEIKELLHNPNHFIWLDFTEPNYEWIRRTFKIPKRIIELCKKTKPAAFYESYREKLFLKTFFINNNGFPEKTQSGQINFLVLNRLILTLHSLPTDCFENLNYNPEDSAKIFSKGADTFTAYLLNALIDNNLETCAMFDNVIKTAEKKLYANDLQGLSDSLFILKKHTLTYKTFTEEQVKNVRRLIKQPPPAIKKISAKRLLNELNFKTDAFYSELSRIDYLAGLITKNCSDKKTTSLIVKQDHYFKKFIAINFIILFILIILFLLTIFRLAQ